MRPLVWVQAAAFVLISAILASPSLAQTAVDPAPSSDSSLPEGPHVAVDPPPAPPELAVLTSLVWLEQPSARDYARLYPRSARDENINASVTIDCTVLADGRMDCVVTNETPPGRGFGAATLQLSQLFRVAPQTRDGVTTEGGSVRRTIRWLVG